MQLMFQLCTNNKENFIFICYLFISLIHEMMPLINS